MSSRIRSSTGRGPPGVKPQSGDGASQAEEVRHASPQGAPAGSKFHMPGVHDAVLPRRGPADERRPYVVQPVRAATRKPTPGGPSSHLYAGIPMKSHAAVSADKSRAPAD